MEWISVETDTPNTETLGGKEILVLVNGKVFLCTVMETPERLMVVYLTENNFLYSKKDGWCGDPRFSKPTHWMPIPQVPKE